MRINNINGDETSMSATYWDVLDVSTEDFEPKQTNGEPYGFYLNNKTDDVILLDVIPLKGKSVVNTPFRPGWNEMQCRCVKQNASVAGKFLWGR